MKVSFCLITNNPEAFKRFVGTIDHALVSGWSYSLCVSYEQPFLKSDLVTNKKLNMITKYRKTPDKFCFATARLQSFELAPKNSDYIIMCDDDFRFTKGSANNRYSASERYKDAILYMEKNPECSAVYMKGFLGGVPYGRKVLPMVDGFYSTGKGIIIKSKNRKYDNIINPEYVVPGVGEDSAIAITAYENGCYGS